MNSQQFVDALKQYASGRGLNITQLADQIKKERRTVSYWLHNGMNNDLVRNKIVSDFPEIFEGYKPSENLEISEPDNSVKKKTVDQFGSIIKIEMARQNIVYLSSILDWFLYETSVEEREHFRKELGDSWKQFLELTRGMTGETAFEVAKKEGRLK